MPTGIPLLGITAVSGALIGPEPGLRKFAPGRLRKVLAVVLALAGIKMFAAA